MAGGKYARLAQETVRHLVTQGQAPPLPTVITDDLKRQQACYVTIYEDPGQRFRTMYGSPLPTMSSLAEEIIINASQALRQEGSRSVRRADLGDLHFEVAVLGPLERISGPENLDISRFGVYVRSDRGKSSVILPHRMGVDTAEEQFATALRESGINLRTESATFYRFSVTYHT